MAKSTANTSSHVKGPHIQEHTPLYVGAFNMGTMECAYMWYHILRLPFKTSIYGKNNVWLYINYFIISSLKQSCILRFKQVLIINHNISTCNHFRWNMVSLIVLKCILNLDKNEWMIRLFLLTLILTLYY